MQNSQDSVYYSKIDWGFFISIIILGPLISSYKLLLNADIYLTIIILSIIFAGLLIMWATLHFMGRKTKYTLEDKGLRIYFPLWYNLLIPYEDIYAIEKTFNLVNAPAFSWTRVKISYGNERSFLGIKSRKSTQISPKNRDDFICELNERIEEIEDQIEEESY